ncbi:hypothetical protein KPH14_012297 [Odynerus spinipes]|uniref:PiggyBac transposable element-derived protein domain-containing protein n=1 Tax=Odynerus spinipes TaxID=1348599 RepID=A0AAD9VM94_9HYME|nr:hypothetical protein KPH14_012297 [Odynerus spinipes]
MPNKPDKFGINFWLAADVQSKYLINGFPYLGKDEIRPSGVPLNEFVVLNLVDNYVHCVRNITTDNFFTSVQLAKKLLAKKTSLVGTMRTNKRELPKIAKVGNDNMPLFSTKLYKSNDIVLTIYKTKIKMKAEGNIHTSNVLDYLLKNPREAEKIRNFCEQKEEKFPQYSKEKALGMMTFLKLSKTTYGCPT